MGNENNDSLSIVSSGYKAPAAPEQKGSTESETNNQTETSAAAAKSKSFFDSPKANGQPAKPEKETAEPEAEKANSKSQPEKKADNNSDDNEDQIVKRFREKNPNFKGKTAEDVWNSIENAQKKINEQSLKIKELEGKKAEEEKDVKKKDFAEKIQKIKTDKQVAIDELKTNLLESGAFPESAIEKLSKAFDLFADGGTIEELNAQLAEAKELAESLKAESESNKQLAEKKAKKELQQNTLYQVSETIFNQFIADKKASPEEVTSVVQYLVSEEGNELYSAAILKHIDDPKALAEKYSKIVEKLILEHRGKNVDSIVKKAKDETANAIIKGNAASKSVSSQNNTDKGKNNVNSKKSIFGFNF